MKKYIVILLISFAPFAASAETNAGVEFLTPLVQQIIHLLQDRITELSAEIAVLKSTIPVCQPVLGTITAPTQTVLVLPPIPEPQPPVSQPSFAPVPKDVTAPLYTIFAITYKPLRAAPSDVDAEAGYYLTLFTNEPINTSKITLSNGSLGALTYNGRRDSVFKQTNKLGYAYEIEVFEVSPQTTVTIEDMAGNKVMKDLVVN